MAIKARCADHNKPLASPSRLLPRPAGRTGYLGLLAVLGALTSIAGPGSTAGAETTTRLDPQKHRIEDSQEHSIEKLSIYVGTYTSGKSRGIYLLELDLKSGELRSLGLAAETDSPSFLAISPSGTHLYAVNESTNFRGTKNGGVSAFAIDPKTRKLTLLNEQPSLGGAPCHLTVDAAGAHVLLANYGGGNVAVMPILADGKLAKASSFIQHKGSNTPHGHSITLDAAGKFAVAADLGLDQLLIYRYDAASGKLLPRPKATYSTRAGAGPRHFDFHPNGRFAYVINETDLTVSALSYDPAAGTLRELQTLSTLPPGESKQRGFSTADLHVGPSGKFLYGSNRGHDTIVVYAIDPDTGKLTYVENKPTGGKTPRNFAIDPTGTYLLAENQSSDTIVVFRIDAKTGKLTQTTVRANVPSPVCIKMLPLHAGQRR